MLSSKNKAVFLDRDGVINRKPREGSYVTRLQEMEFLPDVAEAITLLNTARFLVIVVTNQRCIARGMLKEYELEEIHHQMSIKLGTAGAKIDGIYYCPHEEEPPCSCRKPKPGMLFSAALDFDIDLASSWMIGDSDRDVGAGRNAGCKTVRITESLREADRKTDIVAPSLIAAVRHILSNSSDISLGHT